MVWQLEGGEAWGGVGGDPGLLDQRPQTSWTAYGTTGQVSRWGHRGTPGGQLCPGKGCNTL